MQTRQCAWPLPEAAAGPRELASPAPLAQGWTPQSTGLTHGSVPERFKCRAKHHQCLTCLALGLGLIIRLAHDRAI